MRLATMATVLFTWGCKVIVSASLEENYQFKPSHGEIARLAQVLGGSLNLSAGTEGLTMTGYQEIDKLAIMGKAYFTKAATRTAHYQTEQAFLTAVGATFSLSDNAAVDASSGLSLPSKYKVIISTDGATANHIPQLLARISGQSGVTVISSIYGNFDFSSKIFKGIITTTTLDEFLSYGDI